MASPFDSLKQAVEECGKSYDLERIEKAYKLAEKAHEGQVRASGDPYITHPVAVAKILVDLGMDAESIEASLLHDVVEDTDVTLDEIRKNYDLSILMTTHDFSMLPKYADQVVLIDGGIRTQGRPQEVLTSQEFQSIFHMKGGSL